RSCPRARFSMKRRTREWIRKAENDLLGARSLAGSTPPLYDVVRFHCQQSAEKYLKALLQERGPAIPRVHDLEPLLDLLVAAVPTLGTLRRILISLSQYAVEVRYPGMNATK